MDWRTLLFSFRGRINRAKYWLAILMFAIVWLVFAIAVIILAGGITAATLDASANSGAIVLVAYFIPVIPVAVGLWSGFAILIKRLHDRNKSGWWLLLFWLAPSILNGIGQIFASSGAAVVGLIALPTAGILIWGFVEIACLKGTDGPNDYGPDPLAP